MTKHQYLSLGLRTVWTHRDSDRREKYCMLVCVFFGLSALRVMLHPNAQMSSSKQQTLTNIRSRTLVHVHIFKVMNVRWCFAGSLGCLRLHRCTHPPPSYPLSFHPWALQQAQHIKAWILTHQQNYIKYFINEPKLHKVIKSGWVRLANDLH